MEELTKNNKNIKILTDVGWSEFSGILYKGKNLLLKIITTAGEIKSTFDHDFFDETFNKVQASELKPGSKIQSYNQVTTVIDIQSCPEEPVYDVLDVVKNNRFYANNILVSNCEFIINDETLIAPAKLIDLEPTEPLYKTGEVRWFHRPKKGNIYVVGLDPSLGTGGDFSAIQVFEANTAIQVAEWKNNRTDIPEQIRILADICKHINETVNDANSIYYSVENNTIGEASLISIADYGEENIQGYFLSDSKHPSGGGRRFRKGFNTSNKPKLAACSKLKTMIESKKMQIFSRSLISELKTFVARGTGYAAKSGETDDLVMAAVLVVRMLQQLQNYHGELTSQMSDHGERRDPMPFIAMF